MLKGLKMHLSKQYLLNQEDKFGASDDENENDAKLPPISNTLFGGSKSVPKLKLGGSSSKPGSNPKTPQI